MPDRHRHDARTLALGYSLSRLGMRMVAAMGCQTWSQAYAKIADACHTKPSRVNGLRDEFDPYVSAERKGWHGRPIRTNRLEVIVSMEGLDDDFLLGIALELLAGNAVAEIEEVVSASARAARRMQTGQRAEQWFMDHWREFLQGEVEPVDCRYEACGFDFRLGNHPLRVAEIKGMGSRSGTLSFTAKEWTVARELQANYLLVVVADLDASPTGKVIQNPASALTFRPTVTTQVVAAWTASFEV